MPARGKKRAAGVVAPLAPAAAAQVIVQLPYVAMALVHLRTELCSLVTATIR
jgi:hypothetical protein